MKNLFVHHPIFRLIGPPLYGTMIYLLVLLIFDSLGQITDNFFSQEVMLCVVLTYLLTESLRLVTLLMDRWYPAAKNVRGRMGLQLLANLLCTLLIISAGVTAYFLFMVGYTSFVTELITLNSLFLVSALFYTMLYFSLYYLNQHNQARLAEERTLRQKAELQLLTLKKEVNPTLLYSSLETLISLVHEDAEQAECMIEQLSAIYRYQLEQKHQELAEVCHELKAAQALASIYHRQYRGNVRLHLTQEPENPAAQLVPGSLLRLIEMAVLRTIITDKQPLDLYLCPESVALTLTYRRHERLEPAIRADAVMEELSHAYGFFTDQPVEFCVSEEQVRIKIPLVEVQQPTKPAFPRVGPRQDAWGRVPQGK